MTTRQLRRYEMLVRMIEFGAAHREWFPEGNLAGKSFATVAKAVATLKDLAVAQLARMEGARARRDARAALVETLQRISRTARVIQADDLTFPITCRLPAGESAQAVLTAARLFARGLEAVAASFIAYGPPPPRCQQARKRGYARNPRLDDRRSHDRSAPTGRYRRQSAVRGPCGHCRVGVRPPFWRTGSDWWKH